MVEAVLFIEAKSRKHHMKIVKFKFIEKHRYSDSKKLPCVKGAFLFTYVLSIFLTSTAFVSTKAKYGIPLSSYTVFLKTVL